MLKRSLCIPGLAGGLSSGLEYEVTTLETIAKEKGITSQMLTR